MPDRVQSTPEVTGTVSLRTELALRSLTFAAANGLMHERTDGHVPSIIFGRGEDGRHGNFHPCAYRQICANPRWAKRLQKVHVSSKKVRVRSDWHWKELDCANSSDALLMNIFCHPAVTSSVPMLAMLSISSNLVPEFGFKPRTPLLGGKRDATEIDMVLGHLLVEAKLTESNFQRAKFSLVSRYRDFEAIFDASALPQQDGLVAGYQLVRGILAAQATGKDFCVFCDSRRPDLIEQWYRVISAVHLLDLRCRLKLLTWQELASTLPPDLQHFLFVKYGIQPTYSVSS